MSDDYEQVEIARKDKPDIRFRGKLLHRVSSKDFSRQTDREKTRWTDLELWELESGAWVAATIGCSDKEGEIDVGDAILLPKDVASSDLYGLALAANLGDAEAYDRVRFAMGFWGSTWLAKELARKAGWDVVEEWR